MSVANDKNSENKSENVVNVNEEFQASKEECISFLQSILDKISNRFTKKYLTPSENNNKKNYITVIF